MSRLFRFFLPLAATISLCLSCLTSEKAERRGDNYRALGEYAEAANHYKRAYNLTPNTNKARRGLLQYKMGECYRSYGYSARALGAYRSAERYGLTDTLTLLRQGDMFRLQGDYKSAARAYQDYLNLHPADSAAWYGMASCESAPRLKEEGSAWTVKPEALFNGTRADYSPALLPGDVPQLYFSTTRRQVTGEELSSITGEMAGELAVRHRLPVGDGEQRIPDSQLESRSAQVQLRGEVRPAAGEIAVQPAEGIAEDRQPAFGGPGLQARPEVALPVKPQAGQGIARTGQQDLPERGAVMTGEIH